jgi:hypothetical protein
MARSNPPATVDVGPFASPAIRRATPHVRMTHERRQAHHLGMATPNLMRRRSGMPTLRYGSCARLLTSIERGAINPSVRSAVRSLRRRRRSPNRRPDRTLLFYTVMGKSQAMASYTMGLAAAKLSPRRVSTRSSAASTSDGDMLGARASCDPITFLLCRTHPR